MSASQDPLDRACVFLNDVVQVQSREHNHVYSQSHYVSALFECLSHTAFHHRVDCPARIWVDVTRINNTCITEPISALAVFY